MAVSTNRGKLLPLQTRCYIYKPDGFHIYKHLAIAQFPYLETPGCSLYKLPVRTIRASTPHAVTCA